MFPLMFRLKNRKLLFVGGGKVAERKIMSVIEEDADITVVSPELTESLMNLVKENKICYRKKEFEPEDVYPSYFLVYACTDSGKTNSKVAKIAKRSGISVNIADDPDSSDFHTASMVKHDGLTIAISTEGESPKRSKATRELMESFLKDMVK